MLACYLFFFFLFNLQLKVAVGKDLRKIYWRKLN